MSDRGLIFVTGGNGFIGSRVVRLLVEQGYRVRCLLRQTSNTDRIDDLEFERFIGDVRDQASLTEGMQGAQGCIHLASISAWEKMESDELEDTVISGTEYVMEAALAAGKIRTVFVSSILGINGTTEPREMTEDEVFGLEGTPLRYAIAKHKAEERVRRYVAEQGLPAIIVNPCEVYGPEDTGLITACNLIDFINGWPALTLKGGTAIVHVDDVAQAMVAALEKGEPGERYILGGDNLTLDALARLTLDIAGKPNKTVLRLPVGPVRAVVRAMAAIKLPTPVVPQVLDYARYYYFVDHTKARETLGFDPRPARAVLEPTIAWLAEAGHIKALPQKADDSTAQRV
ncbi:MAG: NAD-dependent epimerase/dehydratase family protein [Bradymonadia bacterium]